jgi:hypothetical protein
VTAYSVHDPSYRRLLEATACSIISVQSGDTAACPRSGSRAVVKALLLQAGRLGFETRWENEFFQLNLILLAAPSPEVHSVSNRNEYQKQKSNVSGE